MKKMFSSSEKIGDIVARFPKASDVFQRYNIDFCCGGDRPLKDAIDKHNIDENKLLAELENEYEEMKNIITKNTDWNKASFSDLIDHIVNTHHSYLQKELPIISELVTKILRVHGIDHGDVLTRVHKLFNQLKGELEQHLIKEEEILFPIIKEYEENPSEELRAKGIKVMEETENEHDNAGDILKELRKITDNYTVPPSGCRSFSLTYEKLEELESDLFRHIHLENNILFVRFEGK
ncbi:iron-sulfur cluster repair di-iron protein [Dethiothermospora halolimnae]|uniref:iron-sulfur cluster repair di-iron protein n=1 Tax=Dethiothermospora halolimnae TaxID=3114390 RepID=UPI003CCC04BA